MPKQCNCFKRCFETIILCLSGSVQKRESGESRGQSRHVHPPVHQKLLPVGECAEEPAGLPGDVF